MRTFITMATVLILTSCGGILKPVEDTPSAQLGEGAIWHPEKEALMWVDIIEGKVFMYKPGEGMVQNIKLGSMVGTVVPASGNYFAVAAQETGIFGLTTDGIPELIAEFPASAGQNVRFNDGKCDPMGRFWVGTMHKEQIKGAADLYMLQNDTMVIKQPDVTISNGIVWDTNKNLMYYIDTPTQSVYSYDYNNETGEISNQRVVIEVPKEKGSPDGMTIDSEGMLWIAHWGGNGVYRWNPDNGELLDRIDVPAPNVTSCAFGGPNLSTMYITTARVGMTEEQLAEYPLSGSLFSIETDFKGLEAYSFAK